MSRKQKRSAVPEYIWYISLIIIALSLVFVVTSIVKRTKKNPSIPDIKEMDFLFYVDPLNNLVIEDMTIQGLEKKEVNNIYLQCEGKYFSLSELFDNISLDNLFAYDVNGYLTLIRKNYIVNKTELNISENCAKKGSEWQIFFGNPEEGGVLLGRTTVNRKVKWS